MKSIVEKLNLTKYQQLVTLNRPQGEYLSDFCICENDGGISRDCFNGD